MLKKNELADNTSCLNKADPLEPIFVLRAKDPLAAQAVRLWAAMATQRHEPEKLAAALHLADQMEKWRAEKMPEGAPPAPQQLNQPKAPSKKVCPSAAAPGLHEWT